MTPGPKLIEASIFLAISRKAETLALQSLRQYIKDHVRKENPTKTPASRNLFLEVDRMNVNALLVICESISGMSRIQIEDEAPDPMGFLLFEVLDPLPDSSLWNLYQEEYDQCNEIEEEGQDFKTQYNYATHIIRSLAE